MNPETGRCKTGWKQVTGQIIATCACLCLVTMGSSSLPAVFVEAKQLLKTGKVENECQNKVSQELDHQRSKLKPGTGLRASYPSSLRSQPSLNCFQGFELILLIREAGSCSQICMLI